jgi:hypothetical protein
MNKKYHHYSTGRYGLVDTFYRNIWLNVDNEKLAHRIKKTFVSKLRLSVFDLTIFSNYTEQTIDSECCLHWCLPISISGQLSMVQHFISPTVNCTQTTYPEKQLVEEELEGLYTTQQRLDLQNQILFYKKIIDCIPGDCALLSSIDTIFQVEIDTNDIENQLYQLSINNLSTMSAESVDILNIIEKLYD